MRYPVLLALACTIATWFSYPTVLHLIRPSPTPQTGNLGPMECVVFFLAYYGLIQGLRFLCRCLRGSDRRVVSTSTGS